MSDTAREIYDPDDPATWPTHERRAHEAAIRASHGHPYECGAGCLSCLAEELEGPAVEADLEQTSLDDPLDDPLDDLWLGTPEDAPEDACSR